MTWIMKETGPLENGIAVEDVAQATQLPYWIAGILHQRMRSWNDQSLDAVKKYLEPSLKNLPDPFSLNDMDRGADRLAEAIVQKESIAIYGDYDVDGTVGSAILRSFLRKLGIDPIVYQPDRQKEGYGVNGGAIEKLAEQGVQLLVTVDCGITNVKEVELANSLGMDVIICDHHEPKEILPPAYAVLDHKRLDNEGPIHSLSGAGVAYYLAIGTRAVLRDIGHFEETGLREPDIKEWLDLVALAAVADLVPLVEENRILLKAGIDKMRKNPSLGIRELLKAAGVNHAEVTTYHLGFTLGPRINASGRLGTANAALELLTTDDPIRASELAQHLNGVNEERIQLQRNIAEEALLQADELVKERGDDFSALLLFNDSWHEGVIGIVASKVVERYHRPVAVITFATHTENGKGSVRGVNGLDMTAALESCSELLKGFGGHKAAAGLSVAKENILALREAFSKAVESQVLELTKGKLKVLPKEIRADLFLESDHELTRESVEFLDRLAPFGMGNPEPVLVISGWKLEGVRTLKERHLKIQFSSVKNNQMEGFWANGNDHWKFKGDERVDIACLPQVNTFKNMNRLELKIKDIRAHQN